MKKNINIYDSKLTEVNFDEPILSFYKGYFENCFIILHPFYSKVFAENYNHLNNYKLTAPLTQKITWSEVLRRTGIKDYKKLALTITYPACNQNFNKLVEHERNEFLLFLEENNIIEPYWREDKIPEDIILSFLIFLIKEGYREIKIGNWDGEIESVKLIEDKLFEDSVKFETNNFITTIDYKYCLRLPYHDLPYTFLLKNILSKKIENELGYEGFFANDKTLPYWHI